MKIAVIGSGGREHAICWKLGQSPLVDKVYAIPGNAGTRNNVKLDVSDFAGIRSFCEENRVKLIFVGPEQPLSMGIVDYFQGSNIMVFGPDKAASQLESSKIFAKEFMNKHGVRTAEYHTFDQLEAASAYCRELAGKCVIKYDGLAAGKGVFVCNSVEEADNALQSIKETYGTDARFLIEELLIGQELSILAFTDGSEYQILLPSQDHKQLLDGDKGPNTGGMGAFCPVEFCNDEMLAEIRKEIIEPSIAGLQAEQFNYHGVLYFGLMLTSGGPKVLEYNVRMGDPETEVVLPALKSDFLELILACMQGGLAEIKPEFHKGYFVDVVLASGGYPQQYHKGFKIDIPSDIDGIIFHAGSKINNGEVVTSGGRVLNVVGNGEDLESAIKNAYEAVARVRFKDMYYRTDIGSRNSSMSQKKKLLIMISGRGSNLEAILKNISSGALQPLAEVIYVFSNNQDANGLEKATMAGIPVKVISSKDKKRLHYNQELKEWLAEINPDFIILAGYMLIVPKEIVELFPQRIINIHPADTLQHQGLHGYEWAWQQRLAMTKITVHFVDAGLDTGRIIAQKDVDLRGANSLEEVEMRGLKAEHEFYSSVLERLLGD